MVLLYFMTWKTGAENQVTLAKHFILWEGKYSKILLKVHSAISCVTSIIVTN